MCKIQKRVFTCNHTTESHLSNCSNHLNCRAQREWQDYWYIVIRMQDECPPCRLETAREKSRVDMIMVTHGTTDQAAINSARLLHNANEQRLRREYGNMDLRFGPYREPNGKAVNKWKPNQPSPLRQVMTPNDVEEERKVVVELSGDEETERVFDLDAEDDEEAEEDLEVGPDGGYDEDGDEMEWQDIPLGAREESAADKGASSHQTEVDIPLSATMESGGNKGASDELEGEKDEESPEQGESAGERRERERKAAIIEYWRRKDSGEVMY